MDYKVLKKQNYALESYSLVPLRKEDLFPIMNWRNEQVDVLRQKGLLDEKSQENYYQTKILPSYSQDEPNIILFSLLKEGECIGYGGLTNIDWQSKRAEVSFLLNTDHVNNSNQYGEEFSKFLDLLKEATFEDLNFNRLFAETFDIRPHHINVLEKNGFKLEGRMKEHVYINNKFVDSLIHGFLKEYYSQGDDYAKR